MQIQYMSHKKYTEGESLSGEELEAISEDLIQAKFDREKRAAWAQELKDTYGVERTVAESKRVFPFSKLAIAAVLLVFAGIVTYSIVQFSSPSYDSVVQESIENLNTITIYEVATRGDEKVDKQVAKAYELLTNKMYEESILLWEQLISQGTAKGTAEFYVALCYLQKETPMFQEAINNLLEARKTKTIVHETNWALALAYLQSDQKEKATEILQEIIRAKAYKYKKATELIELY